MTLLRTQPVRFPRDSSPRPARKPLSFFERLIWVFMVNYDLTREEAILRVRGEYPFLAKEAEMTTYAVTDDGLLVEEPLTWRRAGSEYAEHMDRLVASGRVKTPREAYYLVPHEVPEVARIYEGVGGPVVGPGFVRPLDPLNRPADIEGPRHQPVPVPDALLAKKIQDYRGRYPEVASATTPREFFELLYSGLKREDPANAYTNYKRALITDQELYGLYNRRGA